MAIANKYPTIRPSLNLDFANSKTIDPRITFTRASSATYFDDKGVMRTALAGVPRIDHDPVTGECKGLLLEEARTNLLKYSEQLDNDTWLKTQSSITKNAIVAPDGTLTADALIEDTNNNQHNVTQSQALLANTTYAMTVYVKPAGRTSFKLAAAYINNWAVSTPRAFFDLMAGTVSNIVGESAGIQPVGDGWYRCYLVSTFGATNALGGINIVLSSSIGEFYQGDGTSGIYIWGAQLEVGSFPTSYIKTEASQVTRATDSASMTGANFSSWYRQDEGTLLMHFSSSNANVNAGAAALSDGTLNNRAIIRAMTNSGSVITIGVFDGTTRWNMGKTITPGVPVAAALSYAKNDVKFTANAATPVLTATPPAIPTVNRLYIGADGDGALWLNGHIRRIAYYPRRITNEQLQALTSI